MFHSVEGHEFLSLAGVFDHDLSAGNLGHVEAVERLADAVEQVVCDVDNIVDRAQAYGREGVFEPFGRLLDGDTADCHAGVARAGLGVFHIHTHSAFGVVKLESIHCGAAEFRGLCVGRHPGREVAGHAVVRGGIDAVGGEVHFKEPVGTESVIFCGWCSGLHIVGDYDDAVVRRSDTDLVFGTDHAERFHAADFRFLDGEFLVTVIEGCAYSGHHNGLSGSHIGRAADNLGLGSVAEINGGDVEMVAVGMLDAGQHFADDNAAETSAYRLYFLHRAGLKTYRGEGGGEFVGGQTEIEIFF